MINSRTTTSPPEHDPKYPSTPEILEERYQPSRRTELRGRRLRVRRLSVGRLQSELAAAEEAGRLGDAAAYGVELLHRGMLAPEPAAAILLKHGKMIELRQDLRNGTTKQTWLNTGTGQIPAERRTVVVLGLARDYDSLLARRRSEGWMIQR